MTECRTWFDITEAPPDSIGALLTALRTLPVDCLVVHPEQLPHTRELPDRIALACEATGAEIPDVPFVVVPEIADAYRVRQHGRRAAYRITIRDADSMHAATEALRSVDVLVVRLTEETNIPLELVLAEAQALGVAVVKEVDRVEDAMISAGVLESGSTGVLFTVHRADEILPLRDRIQAARTAEVELEPLEVLSARHVGMGYRGCVDTVTMFDQDEGMLVGSTSAGGVLVAAEVHHLPYMNLRPFRVNAGGVHSYVWGPGGRTSYITDLGAGEQVWAVNSAGRARPAVVGRIKIEIRPMRLIELDGGINVFLQDDWHVRVLDGDGAPTNCSSIRPGYRLLGMRDAPGRHVGISVHETIVER